MSWKWIGAVLIVVSCGGFGMVLARSQRREEWALRELLRGLDLMECELQYRLTPLPELCRQAAQMCRGSVGKLFDHLARELGQQIAPDVASCMDAALISVPDLPTGASGQLRRLGRTLGRFDLNGQIQGLEAARASCRQALTGLTDNAPARHRTYRTLGFCAGAALAILLL